MPVYTLRHVLRMCVAQSFRDSGVNTRLTTEINVIHVGEMNIAQSGIRATSVGCLVASWHLLQER